MPPKPNPDAKVVAVDEFNGLIQERTDYVGLSVTGGQARYAWLASLDRLEQQGLGPRATVDAIMAAELRGAGATHVALGQSGSLTEYIQQPGSFILPAGALVKRLTEHARDLADQAYEAGLWIDRHQSGVKYQCMKTRTSIDLDAVVRGRAYSLAYLGWLKRYVRPLNAQQQAALRNQLAAVAPEDPEQSPQLPQALKNAYEARPDNPGAVEQTYPFPRQLSGQESAELWIAEADEIEELAIRLKPTDVVVDKIASENLEMAFEVEAKWTAMFGIAIGLRKVAGCLRVLAMRRRPVRCDCCHCYLPPGSDQVRRCLLHSSGSGNRRDVMRLESYREARASVEEALTQSDAKTRCLRVMRAHWAPWTIQTYIGLHYERDLTPRVVQTAILASFEDLETGVSDLMQAAAAQPASGQLVADGGLRCAMDWRGLCQRLMDRAKQALEALGERADGPLTPELLCSDWADSVEAALPRRALRLYFGGQEASGLNDAPHPIGWDPHHPLARWQAQENARGICEEDTAAPDVLDDLTRLASWERVGGLVVDEAVRTGMEIPLYRPRHRLDAAQAAEMRSQGMRLREIAEHYGVSVQAVTMALQRRRRASKTGEDEEIGDVRAPDWERQDMVQDLTGVVRWTSEALGLICECAARDGPEPQHQKGLPKHVAQEVLNRLEQAAQVVDIARRRLRRAADD